MQVNLHVGQKFYLFIYLFHHIQEERKQIHICARLETKKKETKKLSDYIKKWVGGGRKWYQ